LSNKIKFFPACDGNVSKTYQRSSFSYLSSLKCSQLQKAIVADGDYLVLDGLLKKKVKPSRSRLPVINFLLNKASSEEEVEVLIMIRPRII